MTRAIQKLGQILAVGTLLFALAGCQTNPERQVLQTTESQVALRSIQTRAFDTSNKDMILRSVVSTLQDLGFVLDQADVVLGSVSGTKFGRSGGMYYQIKATVTVRPRGPSQMLVRMSAQHNLQAIEDPEPYQDFFVALEKSLFLTAHNVD
jgi:hypothetical protein